RSGAPAAPPSAWASACSPWRAAAAVADSGQRDTSMAESFQFDLVSPERRVLSEAVERVDVPGSEGQFGVLAGHAPFMATLRPGVIVAHKAGGVVERIFVRGGFADVNPAGLTILAEDAMPVAEPDPARLAR